MTAIATKLHILPRHLERFSPAPRQGLSFGVPVLDAALPLGVPRGHVTALEAPLGSGGTALLLALAEATLRADEGVVLVDARRSLAPQAAAHLAALGPFWVIRPRGTESAWWCADVLLRTGAFGLVIVDLAPPPAPRVLVRLQRLARDKDCGLVVRTEGPVAPWHRKAGGRGDGGTGGREGGKGGRAREGGVALRLRVGASERSSDCAAVRLCAGASDGPWPGPHQMFVTIEKGGAPCAVEVPVATPLPHRLRPHWAVRDRRGERTGGRSISGRGQRPRAAEPAWPE